MGFIFVMKLSEATLSTIRIYLAYNGNCARFQTLLIHLPQGYLKALSEKKHKLVLKHSFHMSHHLRSIQISVLQHIF